MRSCPTRVSCSSRREQFDPFYHVTRDRDVSHRFQIKEMNVVPARRLCLTSHTPTLVSLPHFTGYPTVNLIYFTMPVQDRTNEFLACVESIRNRSSLPATSPDKQRLLDKQARADSKSEFTRMASAIGKDINNTTIMLGKLGQCVHAFPLFRVGESLTALPQWRNVKRCSMTGRWKSAYVVLLYTSCLDPKSLMITSGTHIRHQARHCKYQQADCD